MFPSASEAGAGSRASLIPTDWPVGLSAVTHAQRTDFPDKLLRMNTPTCRWSPCSYDRPHVPTAQASQKQSWMLQAGARSVALVGEHSYSASF